MFSLQVARLNPCFSGTYSRSWCSRGCPWQDTCLNPCFSGTYSRSGLFFGSVLGINVLILVLVEHTLGDYSPTSTRARWLSLNPCFSGTYSRRAWKKAREWGGTWCLNPCFSGTYSRSAAQRVVVLRRMCLNPCFSGTYSRSPLLFFDLHMKWVLILVLVEHTLGAGYTYQYLSSLTRS